MNNNLSYAIPLPNHSVDDYVRYVKNAIDTNPASYKHLKIGNFFFRGNLTNDHVIGLLDYAWKHQNLPDQPISALHSLTLCDICFRDDTALALSRLLARDHCWKALALRSCSNLHMLQTTSVAQDETTAPAFHVQHLVLTKCAMDDQTLQWLATVLSTTSSLDALDIAEENMPAHEGGEPDTDVASTSDDAEDEAPSIGLIAFADALANSTNLKRLFFNHCTISKVAAKQISQGCHANRSITSIHFPGCKMEDAVVSIFLRDGLTNHPTLNRINLLRNHGDDQTAQAFADATFPHLTKLELHYQQPERAGRLPIDNILRNLQNIAPKLETLNLSFNKLTNADAATIADGWPRCLRVLDLRSNRISDDGISALAARLPHSNLQELMLFGNAFGLPGASALHHAMQNAMQVHVLNLDYSVPLFANIQFYVSLNQAGRRLLRSSNVPLGLWPHILERATKVALKSHGGCHEADLRYHLLKGPALLHSC